MIVSPSLRPNVNIDQTLHTKQSLHSRLHCNPLPTDRSRDNVIHVVTNHRSLLIQRYQCLNLIQWTAPVVLASNWLSSGVAFWQSCNAFVLIKVVASFIQSYINYRKSLNYLCYVLETYVTASSNILDEQQYPRLRPLSCNRMDAIAA